MVENSIYHGIRSVSYKGIIKIYTEIHENYIDIIVEDNGIGFKKSKKIEILKIGGSGIGITNVDKRIKFYYGDEYGVIIDKDFINGARVKIRLPRDCEKNL